MDRSFNKASRLPKMLEGLLTEKLMFLKVTWTISLKIFKLRLWLFKQVWEIQTYIALINVNGSSLL